MKKYFVLAGIFVFGLSAAQENPSPVVPKSFQTPKIITAPKTYKLNQPAPLLSQMQLSHTLSNGNKVYLLQDNMPCVVPDMSQFNMPVMKPAMKNYKIPNPAFRQWRKPGFFTDKQWQKFLEDQKKLQ